LDQWNDSLDGVEARNESDGFEVEFVDEADGYDLDFDDESDVND
jgi:hypothetical protein